MINESWAAWFRLPPERRLLRVAAAVTIGACLPKPFELDALIELARPSGQPSDAA